MVPGEVQSQPGLRRLDSEHTERLVRPQEEGPGQTKEGKEELHIWPKRRELPG